MDAADRPTPSESQLPTTVENDEPSAPAQGRAAGPNREPAQLIAVAREHYDIASELSRGGMGRVSRARDRRLNRTVAIKELLDKTCADGEKRFVREALLTARLQHPGIVPIYEAGRWRDDQPFYSMKLIEGRSLEELIKDTEGLSDRLALMPRMIAVAEAVAYAHDRGVVHRDLKPANVLVGRFGETVVADWGLAVDLVDRTETKIGNAATITETTGAELTTAGTVLGTPQYMAPEQARGEPADTRSDVYALGAMLYTLLVGFPPRSGNSAEEVLTAASSGIVEPVVQHEPEAPADLVAVVDTAMAPEPADRYHDAAELAADLRRFQTGRLVRVHSYSTRELVGRFIRRHRRETAVAAVLSVALLAVIAAGFAGVRRQARVAELERDRAEQVAESLQSILGSMDPRLEELGPNATIVDLLDTASSRLDQTLAGAPGVRAEVLTTLGNTYQGLGMLEPAAAQFRSALTAYRLADGPDHPKVARALSRLAGVVADQGDVDKAERLDREALAMLDRLGLADSSDAAAVATSLASTLRWLDRDTEAESLLRNAAEIRRSLGNPEQERLATTLNNLAVLLGQRNDWEAAAPLARESLDIMLRLHPDGHTDVAAGMDTLGAVLEETGDLSGAEEIYRGALAMRQRLLGSEHPDIARSLYALAGVQRLRGDPSGAIDTCRRVLAMRGTVLADHNPYVAASLQIEGLSWLNLDRPDDAEKALRESLELRQTALPHDHWLVASSTSALGAALTAQKRFPEAEQALLSAFRQLEETRGRDHPAVRETSTRIVDLYRAWGRTDSANDWLRLHPNR